MNFDQTRYASVHHFPPLGARVRVVRGISETERNMARFPDRVYTIQRYTESGYAVIGDVYGAWHVHPEVLEEDRRSTDGELHPATDRRAPVAPREIQSSASGDYD